MTEIVDNNINRMYYPVGKNIEHNAPLIKKMAEAILILKKKHIKSKLLKRDCELRLICTGSSGAIIAAGIVHYLQTKKFFFLKRYKHLSILYIDKVTEESHKSKHYSIYTDDHNVIVDDFVESGATIKHMLNQLNEKNQSFSSFEGGQVDIVITDGIPEFLVNRFTKIFNKIKYISA